MSTNHHVTEEQIRERAYVLWKEAGEPEGRGVEFWQQASEELLPGSVPPKHENDIDEAGRQSFPASDAVNRT